MTVSEEIEAVFLIADLSGYTALTEAHGSLSAAKIVARYFEIITGNVQGEFNRFDPVCHMQVNQDTAPAKLPYQGRTYYFCSFDCAKAFVTSPKLYLS